MEAATLEQIRELRDRIQTLVDEGLMEADLASIWPHVRHQWLELFPESAHVISMASAKGPAFGLLVILETSNQVIEMQERASELRAQKDALESAVQGLFNNLSSKIPS